MEYINFLGYYYGEEELNPLLNALAIAEVPVLPRGDTDTYLLKESAGIELTLSDAESLRFPERDYPDGALVLTNVRYYGKKIGEFSIFQGALPCGIKFGQTKADLISLLGEPEWKNDDESRLRWVRGSHRIHVTLDRDGKAIILSGGLPF
ncbi:hypothetical protein N7373_05775 [Achromobacter mucicolens]|uniref:hypothetical protein n=1 Tax=Achromobacter mucicolens TaxID=1389922 RepID=UPI002448A359|nr:hypothetical protein [Achromobacter mucicolens]MDH0090947.1 hypothetical protein [Achromobacter mucicolens]